MSDDERIPRHGSDQPLHPRGTVRARFAGATQADADAAFRRLGLGARRCDLGDEGLYLAEELVAADRWLGGTDPEALGILVLALMVAQRQGSTRLPLDLPSAPLRGAARPGGAGAFEPRELRTLVEGIIHAGGLELDAARIVKRIASLTAAPRFGSVLGAGDARLPLVVDDHCLYTEHSRWLEQRVAARIAARLAAPTRDVRPVLDAKLSPEQARAVELALGSSLSVITGGPGTGKTLVAAAIVRSLRAAGVAHVALAAPTGKAANRLTEVIACELPDAPPVAVTLHRLLGYSPRGFSHQASSPLPVGALIVDEASMLDLELADALLDALPAHAPLVLVGDAHQLPAVDAGRILADLCEVAGRVATLEHSYRMDSDDPRGRAVYEAARAIHAGDIQPLVERSRTRTPGALAFSGVEWVDSTRAPAARAVAEAVWHHFDGPRAQDLANATVFRFVGGRIDPAQEAELERLWRLASRARILTVTRGLPSGADALNAYLHELALARTSTTARPEHVPGEPVIVTANDYARGLFNGDQGLVVRADEGEGRHRYRAVFRVGGAFRPFALEALRDHLELAWALTVHKSQGSELDAVALVLPDDDLPLVTRELIYTGITRARTSVVVCGPRAVLAAGARRTALRHSGLAARIRATLRP
ncbi:MAG TPA: AAA family ATPase [Kofleriaceae bacterium]|nr:AAA family ATPase [Kofleriaceae bacterium]